MATATPQTSSAVGLQLCDSTAISRGNVNLLFTALLATALGVYFTGNAILMDLSVAAASARIAVVCLMQLAVFYSLSSLTGSVPFGLILTYLLMCITTLVRQSWLIPLIYLLGLPACAYTFLHLRVERKQLWLVLFMASIATVTILGYVKAYTFFDIVSRLEGGNVHKDSLYNVSIAAMIKNYGVVSTGLHGLVSTPYHVLSHVLFADFSLLARQGVLETYGVAAWVFFAPILIFSATACSTMLDRSQNPPVPLLWSAVCALLVLAPFLFYRWGVWDSFFLSESYLVSLGLFMLALPSLFRKHLPPLDLFLLLLMSLLLSHAKATVALIFICLWFSRAVFFFGTIRKHELFILLLSAAAVGFTLFCSASANSGNTALSPFSFVREYSFLGGEVRSAMEALTRGEVPPPRSAVMALAALASFMLAHFSLTWLLLLHTILKKGEEVPLYKVPYAVYACAGWAAGTGIIALFSIAGGSAYYFSNVAFFIALPGVAAIVARSFPKESRRGRVALGVMVLTVFSITCYHICKAGQNQQQSAQQRHRQFVKTLLRMRDQAPAGAVIVANSPLLDLNPVSDCTAQPFIYPAVSEHAWVNVIANCGRGKYRYYGYSQYGITDSQQQITIPPVLPPGTALLTIQ